VSEADKLLVFFTCDEKDHVYVAVTLAEYPLRVGFRVLEELQSRFLDKVGDRSFTATENSLTRTCTSIFKDICTKYSDVAHVDQIAAVQAQVCATAV
jgi:hypothetical protein